MRRANGEGTVYKTIQKIKRKVPLQTICDTCKNCTDQSICNNRTNCKTCPKCQNCTNFSSCDIYYCYEKWMAQVSVDGKKKTIASGKKQKEASAKKILKEDELKNDLNTLKSNVTLPELLEELENAKLEANLIKESSYARNQNSINHIKKSDIAEIPIQDITPSQIQNLLNSLTNYSQSVIEKIIHLLNAGFKKAIDEDIILKNPMNKVIIPYSEKKRKEVIAFDVEEQQTLINYITENKLVIDSKCSYDEETLKNIFLLALYTGARVGELGAIDYENHIDFNKNVIIIERTLTKDKNYKVILGTDTKTGRKKLKKGNNDKREIPFSVFKIEQMKNILTKQINIAKNNSHNNQHLLFCKLNGDLLVPSEINNIFKRICREAGVKLELPKGCNEHMCRHTVATRMIEAGINPMTIAQILGHSSTRELERTYGHILKKFKDAELKKLNNYYNEIKLTS